MQYAILGLLIVVVIGFFVLVWKAAPQWRWYHITTVISIMLLSVIFIFPTAGALKSRAAWHKVKEELELRAEKAKAENHTLKFGSTTNPEAGKGLVALTHELSVIGIETGRVWRSLELKNGDLNGIVLARTQDAAVIPADAGGAAEPAPAAAAAAPSPVVPEGLIVYGFAERPMPNSTSLLPRFYLGEFRVTASTPDQVTLQPTSNLEKIQQDSITSMQAGSWSIYEMLPLDGHEMFIADGSVSDEENLFGRVDDKLLADLFESGISEATLNSYLRDGKQATPDDPPLSRWTRVEFIKKHNEQVDGQRTTAATDGNFFDGTGRALDSRLQRTEGDEVGFKVGDQIVLKEEAANQLIDSGVVKLINQFYIRPLNDYRFVLRRIRLRLTALEAQDKKVEYQKTVLLDAIRATEAMLTTTQADKLKLEQDFDQTEKEKIAIQAYHDQVSKSLAETRAELVLLYNSNQQLERELEKIHSTITERMDSLTLAR
ncbi:hypothetical protein Pla52o_13180 [Novipirellula galeiformis]|uniref:Uncharacterized protein n=1 Tax=Novipirellula galeiformis TaxID=2528004 RepID=A0A5C6CNR3_9BACT|nr:hypothetical protein [Novipirellula galeiformis]TWU25021.1 hypothetical protein Pla52o_13180 [Novipirellula galeiformis]